MDEQRTTHRNRTLKSGVIDFGWGSVECVVRNLSLRGASIEFESPYGLVDRFDLVLTSDGSRRPCRVVWRRGKRLGVVFVA